MFELLYIQLYMKIYIWVLCNIQINQNNYAIPMTVTWRCISISTSGFIHLFIRPISTSVYPLGIKLLTFLKISVGMAIFSMYSFQYNNTNAMHIQPKTFFIKNMLWYIISFFVPFIYAYVSMCNSMMNHTYSILLREVRIMWT